MRRILTRDLFSYIFSTYFIIIGIGFNIANYCCQSCANEGIESVALSSCFSIHNNQLTKQHVEPDNLTCMKLSHQSENCHFFRLKTDIPSFQTLTEIASQQVKLINLCVLVSVQLHEFNTYFVFNNNSPPNIAFIPNGKAILLMNTVLII